MFTDGLLRDTVLEIFGRLEDPDIMRSCVVSPMWRKFVTENHIIKNRFLKIADQADIINFANEHADYALLTRAMKHAPVINGITEALLASSTLSQDFGIVNTIEANGKYWSSIGREEPCGTETLLYRLSELCFVEAFTVHPFQDIDRKIRLGPVFPASQVCFKLGDIDADGVFKETFATKWYPMTSDRDQRFEPEKPILCINKHMMVVFSGFVTKRSSDALYYMCIQRVHVIGRSLAGFFRTKASEPNSVVVEAITYLDPKISADLTVLKSQLQYDTGDSYLRQLAVFLQKSLPPPPP